MPSSPCGPFPDRPAGHLRLGMDGRRSPDVCASCSPAGQRFGPSLVASLLLHAVAGVLGIALVRSAAVILPEETAEQRDLPPGLVWLHVSGNGGGRGGGGDRSLVPAGKALVSGTDSLSIPTRRPVSISTQSVESPPQPPASQLPVVPLGAAFEGVPGSIDGLASITGSRGPGSGGGAGGIDGTGDGPGKGPGHGTGDEGPGSGEGPPGPGSGVQEPVLLVNVRPDYTTEAMRARIQGVAVLECVVGTDGRTSRIRVVRSLDPVFGLDQQAIRAVERWLFAPARRLGRPVAMLVRAEVRFDLH